MMTTEVLSDILESVRQALSALMRGVIRVITSDEKSLTQCLCETKPTRGPLFWPYESDLGLQGELWGSLKCSIECLDCCHGGKDTAIKLSSEVTHRSARRDRPSARAMNL